MDFAAVDVAKTVSFEIPNFIRIYKCGRIERFRPIKYVPPSVDPRTRVSSKDVTINPDLGLSARPYLPPAAFVAAKLPVVVYCHGGSFVTGSPFSPIYHSYLNSLVSKAGVLAVSVHYRLAPEYSLPAAYEDSWEALCWVADPTRAPPEPWLAETADLENIFLADDSAGANIAHDMAMRIGKKGRKVEGLALVHPFFWGRERIGREGEDREGVLYTAKNADKLWSLLCRGTQMSLDNPRQNPLVLDGSALGGLGCRRVMVSVACNDLLRERGRAYFEKLVASGWEGEADFFESEGKDHVFHLLQRSSPAAGELMQRLVNFFNCKRNEGDDATAALSCLGLGTSVLSDDKVEKGATKMLSKMCNIF